MSASISISTSDSYVFTNTRSNDLLLYHNQSNAGVVFGVSNSSNTIRISSNATTFTGAVSFPPASISTSALSGLVQVSSNQAFSNVYTSNVYAQNAALSNLTIPTTLDVTGATIIGLRTINSNQAFSNVYTSNVYAQNAALSNLSVSGTSTFTGAATFNGAVTFPAGSISTSALSGLVQVNSNQAFSNVYSSNVTTSNATVSNLTIPTTLDVTGATIIGLNTINSNQAFSNVYTSNLYASNAAVSNLTAQSATVSNLTVPTSLSVSGASTFAGSISAPGQTIIASNITTEFLSTSNVIYSQISLFSGAAAVNVNSGAMNQGFSNVTVSGSLSNTGTTTLSNLVITGTVEGFNGVSSNQSFSNVYSSNIYGSNVFGSNAAFSNLTIHSSESNNGSLSVAGVLRSATLSNTGTLSNAGAALFSSNVGIGLSNPQYPLDVVGNANFSGNISAGNLGMFRNRIINGNMAINQRAATSYSIPMNTSSSIFCVDRFYWANFFTSNPGSGTIVITPSNLATSEMPFQYGYTSYLNINATAAVTANNTIGLVQPIEANNVSDFGWANGNTGSSCILSFWLKTIIASAIPVAVTKFGSDNFAYITTVQSSSSSAWQYIKVTIPPPPSNVTFNTGSNFGLNVVIGGFTSGSTQASNAWNTTNASTFTVSPSGVANIWGATNNYMNITGVQLEKGTIATPFEFRPYAVELQLCQRYYQSFKNASQPGYLPVGYAVADTGHVANAMLTLPGGPMRTTTPSIITGTNPTPAAWTQGQAIPQFDLYLLSAGENAHYMGNFYGLLNNPMQNNILWLQFADNVSKLTAGKFYFVFNNGPFGLSSEL